MDSSLPPLSPLISSVSPPCLHACCLPLHTPSSLFMAYTIPPLSFLFFVITCTYLIPFTFSSLPLFYGLFSFVTVSETFEKILWIPFLISFYHLVFNFLSVSGKIICDYLFKNFLAVLTLFRTCLPVDDSLLLWLNLSSVFSLSDILPLLICSFCPGNVFFLNKCTF